MKKIIAVRSNGMFSQYELAAYLGISRSNLTMYEQGERSLNSATQLKLLRLEVAYEAFCQRGLPANLPDDRGAVTILESLQQRIFTCKRQAADMKEALETMRKTYRHLVFRWEDLNNILAQEPGTKERLLAEIQLEGVNRELNSCNKSNQLLLQQKIDLLQVEIHLAANKIEQLS